MDEDPTDDVARALMSLGAGTARALEVALRAARDQTTRETTQLERDNDAAIRRLMGTAAAAESHFAAVDADWMRTASAADAANAWEASQRWADLDPGRHGAHAERINTAATDVASVDLRAAVDDRSMTLDEAARMLADAVDQRTAKPAEETRERSAIADATVATSLEQTANSRRAAVGGDLQDTANRRDRLIDAGVPVAAADARLTADKLSGQANRAAAARPALVDAGGGRQRGAKRVPAKIKTHVPDAGVGPER